MSLQTGRQNGAPVLAVSPLLQQEARAAANRWLVRFTPLTDPTERLDADDCRERLTQVPALREEGARVLSTLEHDAAPEDAELLQTLRDAVASLGQVEQELRLRLTALAPADPEAAPDLAAVRTRLAEVAARREVAETIGQIPVPAETQLELPISRGSWVVALFPGVFAFAWLSFTTFHAVFMIGGLMRAVGLWALALLAFYSIFYLAGFAMAWTALCTASNETLTLQRGEATVTRTLFGCSWRRRCTLGHETRAYLAMPNTSGKSGTPSREVALSGTDRELRFGSAATAVEQERLVRRINAYLGVGEVAARR